MTTALRAFALLSAVGVALVLGATAAGAHTRLVGTEPDADATVTEELDTVVLIFSEPVNQTIGEVSVVAPDGTAVEEGAVRIDGERVEQPLARLRVTGEYTVTFRVVASDGHPLTGEFTFTYDGPVAVDESEPTPEPTPRPRATATEHAEDHGHSETTHDDAAGHGPVASDDDHGAGQAAAAALPDAPPWLLAVIAAVLLGFVAASAYAVRTLVRWQPEA
jgi:copper resistance protein C